jgi:hypothetical protein
MLLLSLIFTKSSCFKQGGCSRFSLQTLCAKLGTHTNLLTVNTGLLTYNYVRAATRAVASMYQLFFIAHPARDYYSNTVLVSPMCYIQCLYITTLTIYLHLSPTCFDPVGSSQRTHSKLNIN